MIFMKLSLNGIDCSFLKFYLPYSKVDASENIAAALISSSRPPILVWQSKAVVIIEKNCVVPSGRAVGLIFRVVSPRWITSALLYMALARLVCCIAYLHPVAAVYSSPLIFTMTRCLIKTLEVVAGFFESEHSPSLHPDKVIRVFVAHSSFKLAPFVAGEIFFTIRFKQGHLSQLGAVTVSMI